MTHDINWALCQIQFGQESYHPVNGCTAIHISHGRRNRVLGVQQAGLLEQLV
jgi:hypothetical protein